MIIIMILFLIMIISIPIILIMTNIVLFIFIMSLTITIVIMIMTILMILIIMLAFVNHKSFQVLLLWLPQFETTSNQVKCAFYQKNNIPGFNGCYAGAVKFELI